MPKEDELPEELEVDEKAEGVIMWKVDMVAEEEEEEEEKEVDEMVDEVEEVEVIIEEAEERVVIKVEAVEEEAKDEVDINPINKTKER